MQHSFGPALFALSLAATTLASGAQEQAATNDLAAIRLDTCTQPNFESLEAPWKSATPWVKYFVSNSGELQDIEIFVTSLSAELDRTVLSWVKNCKFRPAMQNGVGKAGTGVAAVRFRSPMQAAEARLRPFGADSCPRGDYPETAKQRGETGTVKLALLDFQDGKVVAVTALRSSESDQLDESAVAWLLSCKTLPPKRSVTEASMPYYIDVTFKLQ